MDDTLLKRLIQVGIVTDVNVGMRKARVRFSDTGITSDWLRVPQRTGELVTVEEAGSHTHDVSEGSCSPSGAHRHRASVTTWMPEIGSTVLVLYLPIFNSDGYILGMI